MGILISGSRGGPRDGDRSESRDGCEYGEHWTTIWTGGACATSGKYTCAAASFHTRFNPVAAEILPAVELVTTTRLLRLVHPPVAYAIDDPITRNFLLIAARSQE